MSDHDRYRALFAYFVGGAIDHLDRFNSRIYYTGCSSSRGFAISGLEGFARIAPLLAAWLYSGRNHAVEHPGDRTLVDLVGFLRSGFLNGTSTLQPGYWGEVGSGDQRILEAADIARAVWLTRSLIWDKLDAGERSQIAAWLSQAAAAEIGHRNNWILASAVISIILQQLGAATSHDCRKYFEFKSSSFLEEGWFSDGPNGHVDYYNTWGISYDLFWINLIAPDVDSDFITEAIAASAILTSHLISPRGIPILGRSLCYRTAVAVPLLAASLISESRFSSGKARRGLDLSWRYFIAHNCLRDGGLTMGYLDNDLRLVDSYSGSGSCHWGVRSLVLAFMAPPAHALWTNSEQPLPIEERDYKLTLPKIGWTIAGDALSQEIIVTQVARSEQPARVESFTLRRKLKEQLYQRPVRPQNAQIKYELRSYSSRTPLGGVVTSKVFNPSWPRVD